MSVNGEIYTAGKNFTLLPSVTNLTSTVKGDKRRGIGVVVDIEAKPPTIFFIRVLKSFSN